MTKNSQEKYVSAEGVRFFYNKKLDRIEMTGTWNDGDSFKFIVPENSTLDKTTRNKMVDKHIIQEHIAPEAGLPPLAILDFGTPGSGPEYEANLDGNYDLVRTLFQSRLQKVGVDQWNSDELEEQKITPASYYKSSVPELVLGISQTDVYTRPLFSKGKPNIFVQGSDRDLVFDSIKHNVEYYAEDADVITLDTTLFKSSYPVYHDPVEFLVELRKVNRLVGRIQEKTRKYVFLVKNFDQFFEGNLYAKGSPSDHTEKAVRKEIIDIFIEMSTYNQVSENLNVTTVFFTSGAKYNTHKLIETCGVRVEAGFASGAASQILFGVPFMPKLHRSTPGRGFMASVESEYSVKPFQSFIAID